MTHFPTFRLSNDPHQHQQDSLDHTSTFQHQSNKSNNKMIPPPMTMETTQTRVRNSSKVENTAEVASFLMALKHKSSYDNKARSNSRDITHSHEGNPYIAHYMNTGASTSTNTNTTRTHDGMMQQHHSQEGNWNANSYMRRQHQHQPEHTRQREQGHLISNSSNESSHINNIGQQFQLSHLRQPISTFPTVSSSAVGQPAPLGYPASGGFDGHFDYNNPPQSSQPPSSLIKEEPRPTQNTPTLVEDSNHTVRSRSTNSPTNSSGHSASCSSVASSVSATAPTNSNSNNSPAGNGLPSWNRLLQRSNLIQLNDRDLVPDALFVAMGQMQPCKLTQADRVGCYKSRDVGFVGMCCKHCGGQPGFGRYFPNSVRSLAQTTTSQTILKHVASKCRFCPPDIRNAILELQQDSSAAGIITSTAVASTNNNNNNNATTARPRYGSRKIFFQRIWARLHEPQQQEQRDDESADDDDDNKSHLSSKPTIATSNNKRSRAQYDQNEVSSGSDDAATPSLSTDDSTDGEESFTGSFRSIVHKNKNNRSYQQIPLTADHVTKRQKFLAL